jgi:hypothetical protein
VLFLGIVSVIKKFPGNVYSIMKKEISHQDTKAQRVIKKEIFSNKKNTWCLGVLVPWWQ